MGSCFESKKLLKKHLESWEFELKLRKFISLEYVWNFLSVTWKCWIGSWTWLSLNKIFCTFMKLNFLRSGILVLKTMENGDCTSIWLVSARPNLEVPASVRLFSIFRGLCTGELKIRILATDSVYLRSASGIIDSWPEVLWLGPVPDSLQMGFFLSFPQHHGKWCFTSFSGVSDYAELGSVWK
jgi:hypothetical protein